MTDHVIWRAMDVLHQRLAAITAGASHQFGTYNFTPGAVYKGKTMLSAGEDGTVESWPTYGIMSEPVEPQTYTNSGSKYIAEANITITARYEITDYTDQERDGWRCVADITAAILLPESRGKKTLGGIITDLEIESQSVEADPQDQIGLGIVTFLARFARATGEP